MGPKTAHQIHIFPLSHHFIVMLPKSHSRTNCVVYHSKRPKSRLVMLMTKPLALQKFLHHWDKVLLKTQVVADKCSFPFLRKSFMFILFVTLKAELICETSPFSNWLHRGHVTELSISIMLLSLSTPGLFLDSVFLVSKCT